MLFTIFTIATQLTFASAPSSKSDFKSELEDQIKVFRHISYIQNEKPSQRKDPVSCKQYSSDSMPGEIPKEALECRYLNIWAPNNAENTPVLIYIHGGGLLAGSGLKKLYSGSSFAKSGIVFVSFNYRLSPVGDRNIRSTSISDMVNAIKWVETHIEKFGGNPRNITLMGHSAGADAARILIENNMINSQKAILLSQSESRGRLWLNKQRKSWLGKSVWVSAINAEKLVGRSGYRDVPSLFHCPLFDFYSGSQNTFINLLHPDSLEHGAEIIALFQNSDFGKKLLDHLVNFIKKDSKPLSLLDPQVPQKFTRLFASHIYKDYSILWPLKRPTFCPKYRRLNKSNY